MPGTACISAPVGSADSFAHAHDQVEAVALFETATLIGMARDSLTDAELLRRRRDPEAFRVLYQRHIGAVYASALTRVTRHDVAVDLAAETFAAAWRHARRFEDRADGSALPWLLGITRNLALAYHRKQRLEQRALRSLGLDSAIGDDGPENTVVELAASDELRRSVRGGLDSLTGDQREVIQLRVLDGLPYREIGARLGCDPAAARMRVNRALRPLQQRVTGESA